MSGSTIAIVKGGLVCGVGLNAPAALAAIRGAISEFRDTTYTDIGGELIAGSGVPLERPWRGRTRLRKMLCMAVSECLENVELSVDSLPLLLCVSERERPGRIDGLEDGLLRELETELHVRFHPAHSGTISEGRVGAVLALTQARRLILDHGVPGVVIAGVDNLLGRHTLRALEKRDRLRTSRNSNGLIPGEAASAVLVRPPSASSGRQLMCVGLGYGIEGATVESEDPLRAEGLTHAIRAALADAQCTLGELDFSITDNSGEQYYFKEAALALARTLRVRKEEFDMWHPADCIGDVGAAVGPILLNVALVATLKGYAKGDGILCHLGNDAGQRAAAILRFQ